VKTVSVYDAKTHLSQLIAEVEAGERVVITRNGAPVAQLVGMVRPVRRADALRGLVLSATPDALAPMSEAEIAALEGGPLFPVDP
jgi:prevent-host-death family protein